MYILNDLRLTKLVFRNLSFNRSENQQIGLTFPIFDQECTQNFKYLNKHCSLSLPDGGLMAYIPITNDAIFAFRWT